MNNNYDTNRKMLHLRVWRDEMHGYAGYRQLEKTAAARGQAARAAHREHRDAGQGNHRHSEAYFAAAHGQGGKAFQGYYHNVFAGPLRSGGGAREMRGRAGGGGIQSEARVIAARALSDAEAILKRRFQSKR
jgi:hypothetical protein